MNNPYIDYFEQQAATGISGFEGTRYQRGHGFFGRILKGVYPLIRILGPKMFSTGANIASDVFNDNQDIKKSLKRRLVESAEDLANEGLNYAKRLKGEGLRERKIIKRKRKPKYDLFD